MKIFLRSALPDDDRRSTETAVFINTSNDVPIPLENPEVSQDQSRNTLSRYSDNRWDLSAYQRSPQSCSSTLNFSFLPASEIGAAKWIMFVIIFMADPRTENHLSTDTIVGYMKCIRPLAQFAHDRKIRMLNVLSNEKQLLTFIGTIKSATALAALKSVMRHLHYIGPDRSKIKVIRKFGSHGGTHTQPNFEDHKQHPVIPPRILASLMEQLQNQLAYIEPYAENLTNLMVAMSRDRCLARGPGAQRKLSLKTADMQPGFEQVSRDYGLAPLFQRYGISGTVTLLQFLGRLQHACKLMLHLFSGMRAGEAASLKANCLRVGRSKCGKTYTLTGTTTKLVKGQKPAEWITSPQVEVAISIASKIAHGVAEIHGANHTAMPLFVSLTYTGLQGEPKPLSGRLRVNKFSVKSQEFFTYLDQEKFWISRKDLDELDRIDSFRAWEAEEEFQVGQTWRFSTHQFRRSLAFYIAQSSLVSLPSLKRQLKHLTREMTIYYSHSTDVAKEHQVNQKFSRMLEKIKPEADASAYLNDVLTSMETLHGGHGSYIERTGARSNSGRQFDQPREKILQRFKRGEIAYSETAMGACTSTGPCNKKFFRVLSACISCKDAVIKQSKLENLIRHQQSFVAKLQPGSIEFRTESIELQTLEDFGRKLAGGSI